LNFLNLDFNFLMYFFFKKCTKVDKEWTRKNWATFLITNLLKKLFYFCGFKSFKCNKKNLKASFKNFLENFQENSRKNFRKLLNKNSNWPLYHVQISQKFLSI
jgi:hypothetical protein